MPTSAIRWYLWQIRTTHLPSAVTLLTIVIIRNLLIGVMTPIYVARLITHLGTDQLSEDVSVLIGCVAAAGMAEVLGLGFRQYVSFGVRRALIETLSGFRRKHLPLARFTDPITNLTDGFLESWRDFMMTLFNRVPVVAIGFGGLAVVAFVNGMVLMGVITCVLALFAPFFMYMTTKRVLSSLKKAGDAERREQAMLGSIFENFDMRFLHPVLDKKMNSYGNVAKQERQITSWVMRRRTGEVQVLNIILTTSAVIMSTVYHATSGDATKSALIVTIVLVLTSNLSLIHSILESFHDANSRSQEFVNLLARSIEKPFMPVAKAGEDGIRTEGLHIIYKITLSDESIHEKEVVIPKTDISAPGLICLSSESGRGKSTFFSVIVGFLDDYQGSVTIGGYEAGNYICTQTGLVRQKLKDIDLQIAELFGLNPEREEGEDWKLYRQIFAWVGFSEVIPTQIVKTLSGGEMRRVLTACGLYRAVKLGLRIIILDEPTNDLDKRHISILCEGLRAFATTYDIYVIVASHDPLIQKAADQQIAW